MDDLTVTQIFSIAIIVIPGFVVGLASILLKKDIGLWLMGYGLLVAIPGLALSILVGKPVLSVLFLEDTEGFGRAFLSGCLLFFAGMVSKFLFAMKKLFAWRSDDK
ncbi:MAG: hypothetical protein QNJ78_13335 [Gammaproteobacteria bacterium]|nr:hypothetical protein [Gammaproteobacteria bacterium]